MRQFGVSALKLGRLGFRGSASRVWNWDLWGISGVASTFWVGDSCAFAGG